MLALNHPSIFAYGHAIDHRHGMHPDKTPAAGRVQDRAVSIGGVGGGTVQHDDRNPGFGASFHHVMQGGNIGIEAKPYVLKVEKQDVDILQVFRCRLLVIPVERYQRKTCLAVNLAVDLGSGFGLSPEPVFG